MVGCGTVGTQAVLLNPTANGGAGSIVSLFHQISGTDQIWYDPTTKAFYVTGVNAAGDRVFVVISDVTDSVLQTIGLPTTTNAHSIAVSPFNGDVFVPLGGSTGTLVNSACALGCIAVFSEVPIPATWPLLATGIGGLGLLGWRRKRKAQAGA
jgi:hypothetical protein